MIIVPVLIIVLSVFLMYVDFKARVGGCLAVILVVILFWLLMIASVVQIIKASGL